MSLNIKILTAKALIISAFLFSFSPAFAQYKLELDWMNEPGGGAFYISSITKSDNDSILYVSGSNSDELKSYIYTVNTSSGSIISKINTKNGYVIKISKDGNTLVAAGGYGIGLLNPVTFERVYWDTMPELKYSTLYYNEFQNKAVICGNFSLMRVYDLTTKERLYEFGSSYFEFKEVYIQSAKLTNDGKHIIYSTWRRVQEASNWKDVYEMKMIDLQGNEIYNFGEIASPEFGFTIDGKQLIYATGNNLNFFSLEQSKIVESIAIPLGDFGFLLTSNDGKFLLVGGGVISYIDLENKKSISTELSSSSSRDFILNHTNSSLYTGESQYLQKFNLKPTTSVVSNHNNLDFHIQVVGNDLIVKFSDNSINPNFRFNIIGMDGKDIKQFNPNVVPLTTTSAILNIADLAAGTYFLRIADSQNTLAVLKFLKVY